MLKKRNLGIAAAVFALAGCANSTNSMMTTSPMSAATVHSSSGAEVHTHYAPDALTGRNWNCTCPMCISPRSMRREKNPSYASDGGWGEVHVRVHVDILGYLRNSRP